MTISINPTKILKQIAGASDVEWKLMLREKNELKKNLLEYLVEIKKATTYHEIATQFSIASGKPIVSSLEDVISVDSSRLIVRLGDGRLLSPFIYDDIDGIIAYDLYKQALRQTGASGEGGEIYEVSSEIRDLVETAMKAGSTDIHINCQDGYYSISYRILGDVINVKNLQSHEGLALVRTLKQDAVRFSQGMKNFTVEETIKIQDARLEIDDIELRLAFTKALAFGHQNVSIRILKKEQSVRKQKSLSAAMEALGYDEDVIKITEFESRKKKGIIILSGATGSGKSTLVSTVLTYLPPNLRILTVEDPVEYRVPHPSILQHQIFVSETREVNFSDYLKAFLRKDPDVILVGEMRDDETASLALKAANTGHLVFTTLHTNTVFDVPLTMYRRFGVPKDMIETSLNFIINQSLVKKICPKCSVKRQIKRALRREWEFLLTPEQKKKLVSTLDEMDWTVNTVGPGCPKCTIRDPETDEVIATGFSGRTPITEYLRITEDIKPRLFESSVVKLKELALKKKRASDKFECFLNKVKEGTISLSSWFYI